MGIKEMIYSLLFPLILIHPIQHESQFDKNNFNIAIYNVLKEEGGLVDDKSDKGGITKYGISLNYLKGLIKQNPELLSLVDYNHNKVIDSIDISNITHTEALYIYKKFWWDKYNYGKIYYQPLARKIFDVAINIGPYRACDLLLKAAKKEKYYLPSLALNIEFVSYLNSLSDLEKEKIISRFKVLLVKYYSDIAYRNPSQRKYLKGWIKRANK